MTEQEIVEEYLKYTEGALDELAGLLGQLQSGKGSAAETNDAVFAIAHNVKGMGTSFNYDLMTNCGSSLCAYVRGLRSSTLVSEKVVAGHLKAMQAVLNNQIQGDGGETGAALLVRLQEIIANETAG